MYRQQLEVRSLARPPFKNEQLRDKSVLMYVHVLVEWTKREKRYNLCTSRAKALVCYHTAVGAAVHLYIPGTYELGQP